MAKNKAAKAKPTAQRPPAASAMPSQPAAACRPSWPPFKPPLPVTDLRLELPVPTLDDTIAVVRNFWPRSLCRDYVTFLQDLPLTTTPGRPKRGEAVRVNDRFQIDDFQFAQRLWLETGLKELLLEDSVSHLW